MLPLLRRAPLATAAALAALLALPGLLVGRFMDDWLHLSMLEGLPAPGRVPLELFTFATGDPERIRGFVERGPFPWWTLATVKLSFFRPLSSLLAAADHRLFGAGTVGPHLHSLGWYVATVLAAGLVLRRALPAGLAAAALLLFAVDDAHALPVLWLSNRNALVAAAPALLGIAAHLRFREGGGVAFLPLSLLALAAGLAAGEVAVGAFGYLAAYELAGRDGPLRGRLLALAPAALLAAAYLALYKALGYGAAGSSTYVDPSADPAGFLAVLPGRGLALAAAQLLGLPAELWLLAPATRPLLVGAGALAVLGAGWLLARAFRALPAAEARAVRWLALGALLAALPSVATFPANRLLLLPSLGGAVALATLLRAGAARLVPAGRALAGAILLVHGGAAALGWPVTALALVHGERAIEAVAAGGALDEATPSRRVVLVAAPEFATGYYPPILRATQGRPFPAAWWTLSIAPYEHRLVRLAADTVELEVVGGRMLDTVFEELVRDDAHALPAGAVVSLPSLEATVLELDAGRPRRVRFRFDAPLEDGSLLFLQWRDGGLRRLVPPPVGGAITLPREPGPLGI